MRTFGIFNAAGCVEPGFTQLADAMARIGGAPTAFEDCYPAECCPRHTEQERSGCIDCAAVDVADAMDDAPSGHWVWVSSGP